VWPQGAVREWDTQNRRLRSADDLLVFAGSLITGLAVGTGVIGGEKGTDDELPGLMEVTPLPTSSTMPQYSCPIGVGSEAD